MASGRDLRRVLLEQIWVLAMPSSEFQGLLELDSTALCPLCIYRNWSQSGEELMSGRRYFDGKKITIENNIAELWATI